MLNGVKFPCQIGGSAERTGAVVIAGVRKKRVIFQADSKKRILLDGRIFENLQQALPIWTPAWPT